MHLFQSSDFERQRIRCAKLFRRGRVNSFASWRKAEIRAGIDMENFVILLLLIVGAAFLAGIVIARILHWMNLDE